MRQWGRALGHTEDALNLLDQHLGMLGISKTIHLNTTSIDHKAFGVAWPDQHTQRRERVETNNPISRSRNHWKNWQKGVRPGMRGSIKYSMKRRRGQTWRQNPTCTVSHDPTRDQEKPVSGEAEEELEWVPGERMGERSQLVN